jgi:sugar/nucleoside kinase (ribokinase family)
MLAVLGDLVEDVVVRLDGPVNVASDTSAHIVRRRGGSAANTAACAAALGHAVRFLGQVGIDAVGTALTAELAAGGVDVTWMRQRGSTGTIIALVDHLGERSMLTDRQAWLDGVDVLHVPFYSLAAGRIAATSSTVIGWAHERAIAVSIDLSSVAVLTDVGVPEVRRRLSSARPSILFANADEAAALGVDGPVAGALTVVKRGPNPAIVHRGDGTSVEVPALEFAAIHDTTGAGDAFAAGFLTSAWADDPVTACAEGHRAAADLLRDRAGR